MSVPFFGPGALYHALLRRNTHRGWSHPKKTQWPSSGAWWADTLLAIDPWFEPLPDDFFVGVASTEERDVSPSPLEEVALAEVGKPYERISCLAAERREEEEQPAGRARGGKSLPVSGGGRGVVLGLRGQESARRQRRRSCDVAPDDAVVSAIVSVVAVGAAAPQVLNSGSPEQDGRGDDSAESAGQTADSTAVPEAEDGAPAAEGGEEDTSPDPLPAEIVALANYINGLRRTTRGRSGMHQFPSRNILKKDQFLKDEVSRKIGCLKVAYRGGKLREHYGDTRLFTQEMWDYLCNESYTEKGGSGVQRPKRKRDRSNEDQEEEMADGKRAKTEEEDGDDPEEGMWT